jgi:hypothetical protein
MKMERVSRLQDSLQRPSGLNASGTIGFLDDDTAEAILATAATGTVKIGGPIEMSKMPNRSYGNDSP